MRHFVITLFVFLTSVSSAAVLMPRTAFAAIAEGCGNTSVFLGFPTWYRYLDIGPEYNEARAVVDKCAIIGPVYDEGEQTGKLNWQAVMGRVSLAVVEIMLRIVGLVAVAYVMYGGFRYITSQGEPENVKSARQTIINGLIGLVISLIAAGAVAFIASELTEDPPATNNPPVNTQNGGPI